MAFSTTVYNETIDICTIEIKKYRQQVFVSVRRSLLKWQQHSWRKRTTCKNRPPTLPLNPFFSLNHFFSPPFPFVISPSFPPPSLHPHTGFVKGVARPDYWVPDHEIVQCNQCQKVFTPSIPKHHCRACGQGVCASCSAQSRPVPSRGWDHPVRVCDSCAARKDSL